MTSTSGQDLRKYVEEVEYPALTEDLVAAAEARGAPTEVMERLRSLGEQQFGGPEAVLTTLRSPRQPGRVPDSPAASGANGGAS